MKKCQLMMLILALAVVQVGYEKGYAAGLDFDFETGVPDGTAVYGNARVDEGILKLTDGLNSQQGSFVTDPTLPSLLGFDATFQVRLADSTCCTSGADPRPADGFSFVVAPDIPDASFGEEGAGTGLIVAFDAWDNGGADTAPAIDVVWGGPGSVLDTVSMAEPREGGRDPVTEIPTDPVTAEPMTLSTAGYPAGEFVPVRIQLDPDGTVDVSYKGVLVLDEVAIPDFTSIADARFGFGARTGGANQAHWVDDLEVTLIPEPSSAMICSLLGLGLLFYSRRGRTGRSKH
jgi:hypothetical protein